MKVLLIGANGQLGSDIRKEFTKQLKIDLVTPLRKEMDVADFTGLKKFVNNVKPSLIINTAAFHNVDICEEEPLLAFTINTLAQKHLCDICKELNIIYVFTSTDYVFDGNKISPYNELDCPLPLNTYGISKLAGEQIVRSSLDKYFIIRVSGLYGDKPPSGKKSNFVDLILTKSFNGEKIKVVDDQVLTPTSTLDVAKKLLELINSAKYGLYHLTNTGCCSWYDFAMNILDFSGLKADIEPCKTGCFGEKAKRPHYSVLDNLHLRNQGFEDLPPWQEALKEYLINKKVIK